MQPDLPMTIPELPFVTVIEIWGGPPRRMFLKKHLELLPWDPS